MERKDERKEEEVAEEYLSSLADLTLNSKPLINMLTILAEENIEYAPVIVKAVEQYIAKVNPEVKLPILYLIDSIVKNVGREYVQLFSHSIVNIFCGVFEKVSEKIREKMYTLRQTWNDLFSPQKLYTLDVKVNCMDPNWPITAKVPKSPAIHVNPNFLKNKGVVEPLNEVQSTLRDKQRRLLELQKHKLELELAATRQKLEEQEKQLSMQADSIKSTIVPPVSHPGGVMNVPSMAPPMFSNFKPPVRQPGLINMPTCTMAGNTSSQSISTGKPRVAPVNPGMINTLRQRDPRLARQQQQMMQQQQKQSSDHPINSVALSVPPPSTITANNAGRIGMSNIPLNTLVIGAEMMKSDEDLDKSSSKNNLKVPSSSITGRGLMDRHKLNSPIRNSNIITSIDSKKSPKKIEKSSGKSSSNTRSISKSNSSKPYEKEKDKERDKDKERNSGKEKGNSLNDRKRGTKNNSSPNKVSFSSAEKLSSINTNSNNRKSGDKSKNSMDVAKTSNTGGSSNNERKYFFKATKTSTKERNYMRRNKDKSRSPSPDSDKESTVRPEKKAKLGRDSTTLPLPALLDRGTNKLKSSSMFSATNQLMNSSSSITSIKESNNLPKIGENLETASCKDVDLRQFQTKTGGNIENCSDEITVASPKLLSADRKDELSAATTVKGVPSTANEGKKRQSTDKFEEPASKKSKSERIDALFGTEDVDLRTINSAIPPKPLLSSVMPTTPPPPPIISNESENWAKVKSAKGINISPQKSKLDDVRAKLAKAARGQLSKFEKSKDSKKKHFNSLDATNEDSQDGTDANIRTIISQAQELLNSDNINMEQYNSLLKTMIQINETNKLKEAQRRESLSNHTSTSLEEERKTDPHSLTENIGEIGVIAKLNKLKALQNVPQSGATVSSNKEESNFDSQTNIMTKNSLLNQFPDRGNIVQGGGGNKLQDKRRRDLKWSPWEISLKTQNQQQIPWMAGGKAAPLSSATTNLRNPPPIAPGNNKAGSGNLLGSVAGGVVNAHNLAQNMTNRMPILNPWQNPPPIIFAPPVPTIPLPVIPSISAAPLTSNDTTAPISATQLSNSVDNPKDDVVRTINIDSVAKEIRIYDEIAVVFMDWDQPREIGFQNGQRRIVIDDLDPIILNFNDSPKSILISGKSYKIRFGCPSRELYVDENWYECCFGGPPLAIRLDGQLHVIKIEGPPPQVNIGNLRQDLVVGKINIIIDAHIIIPVFLDAKTQKFELNGKKHTLQFADDLQTVLIDNEPMHVEYGGLPKSMFLGARKYFVRFSALPNGITPGKIKIRNMIRTGLNENEEDTESSPNNLPINKLEATSATTDTNTTSISNTNSYGNELPRALSPTISIKDDLSKLNDCKQTAATLATDSQSSADNSIATSSTMTATTNDTSTATLGAPAAAPNLNIEELFQKLIASGILNQSTTTTVTNNKNNSDTKNVVELITSVDLSKPETIKTRQAGIVNKLFSGMQCSSCGVRFPPEQTMKYSQHLDWHFRQNRRERDSSRKAHSRKWYYDVSDWIQYEEIEDLEDREKNWFETQQTEVDNMEETSNPKANSPPPSCPAGPEDVDKCCDMCHDKFEQYYNEEFEEWHLRSAIRVEDKIYHPLCYQDYKASLQPKIPILPPVIESDDNAVDTDITVKEEKADGNADNANSSPMEGKVVEDEDDDVIVLPNEEPIITEIPDDDDEDAIRIMNNDECHEDATNKDVITKEKEDTLTEPNENNSGSGNQDKSDSIESDVEIQEPHIPFTDLDTYEEGPAKTISTLDESSESSQQRFGNVRIKEEPKDEYDEEDDAFEDVGTVITTVEDISQSCGGNDDEYVPMAVTSTNASGDNINNSSRSRPCTPTLAVAIGGGPDVLLPSIDGNIEIQDNLTTNVGVNKIKINIMKNVSNNNNNNNSNNNVTTQSKSNVHQIETVVSTIPVICNKVQETTGSKHIESRITGPYSLSNNTLNSSSSNKNSNIINISSSSNTNLSSSSNIITVNSSSNSVATSTSSFATNPAATSSENKTNNDNNGDDNSDDTDSISFEFKSELKNVDLKTVPKMKSGYETSGLCSIM